jgi:tripartite-type tricarboxylate transporter receptor subunit TctC
MKIRRRELLIGTMCSLSTPALAQTNWPTRPITLIVCFPPGGSTDFAARMLAPGLAEMLGQPVVVENRGGAGGNIAMGQVARAAPDGYTMLVASSVFVVNSSLYRRVPYDPFRDFSYIAIIGASPNVLAVRSDLNISNFNDLLAAMRANPDQYNCGVPGIGTTPHLAAEILKLRTGASFQTIPFQGAGPAVQAILSGSTEIMMASQGGQVQSALQSGAIKLLAQTGAVRDPDMADVPTLKELGVDDAESETFNALYAPVAVPEPIVMKVARAAMTVLSRADVRERYRLGGVPVVGEGPNELRARVAREVPMWRKVIEDSKIVIE